MNYKRGVIEKFITQDLPKGVAEELERGSLADQSQAARELADEVFVNGDSFIPNAKALEPVFKARMFASVEI